MARGSKQDNRKPVGVTDSLSTGGKVIQKYAKGVPKVTRQLKNVHEKLSFDGLKVIIEFTKSLHKVDRVAESSGFVSVRELQKGYRKVDCRR